MKFHFMNGTMRATSSKKKMTAILLGLTMTLAPYGMTSAEVAQAAEHPAAAAAVTTEAAAPQAANAADGKAAAEKQRLLPTKRQARMRRRGPLQHKKLSQSMRGARSTRTSTSWQRSRTARMTSISRLRRRRAAQG